MSNKSQAEWLDSETFVYHVPMGSVGPHKVLRRQHDHPENNRWLTASKHAYYMWKSDSKGHMWWECFNTSLAEIIMVWVDAEEEDLPRIELAHDGFEAHMDQVRMNLGSEIQIIPRMCYELTDLVEKWIVDRVIPTGEETCVFHVYGKDRIEWFQKRAILDEPMTIALRKFSFQEIVV